MLSGLMPGISKPMVLMIFRVLASITDTVPPTSDVTQSCDPSAVNSAKRGRVPTSTLSTISKLLVSMKCAMFEVSDVAISVLAVRADADALRLDADRHLGQHLARLEIDHRD